MSFKYFDPIFGNDPVEISDDFWVRAACHPNMTRLRNIHQVGNISHIHLVCTQTRYIHSLGTAKRIDQILPMHVDKADREKAIFAGICHDLGHGPFSHSFEHFILPKSGIDHWRHEELSVLFAQQIYDTLIEPSFDMKNFAEILHSGTGSCKNDVFQLVSSKTTGFDADRYDYLSRDSWLIGRQLDVSWERLVKGIEFRPDTMGKKYCQVLKRNAVPELAKFLKARYHMFENFYHTPSSLAVELLVSDIFAEANKFCRWSDAVNDPEGFSAMDDSILLKFKKYKKKSESFKQLYERFEKRDFYTFCGGLEVTRADFWSLSKAEREKAVKGLEGQLVELLSPKLTENDVDFAFMEANEFKDVNLEKTYYEAVEGNPASLELVGSNPELVALFGAKKSAVLNVFCKNSDHKQTVGEAICKLRASHEWLKSGV